MTHTIKYPVKFYLLDLILYFLGIIWAVVGFCMLLAEKSWWAAAYAVLFLIFAAGLFFTICNIQWIKIDEKYISAYNVFGLIKRFEISQIQTVAKVRETAFGWRHLHKKFSCIVVSRRKTKPVIVDAYNQKENPYIILPYSEENRLTLEKFNLPPLKNPNSY